MDIEELYALQREEMVELIEERGVTSKLVLEAMATVPRHLFVPEKMRVQAYEDGPLPIGAGQTISQPFIVALMLECAQLTPEARVLDIGTGSGYSAAVTARIVKEVYTIERIPELADQAERCFKELDLDNITTCCGDGTLGWKEEAPFDAILVAAGAPVVPETLVQQLKPQGVMVIPVGTAGDQKLLKVTPATGEVEPERKEEEVVEEQAPIGRASIEGAKRVDGAHGSWNEELIELVRFVPLIGEKGWAPPKERNQQ